MPRKINTTEEMIRRYQEVHGDKYSYDNTVYTGWSNKIQVTCKYHGDFWIPSHNHLAGNGCPECGKISFHQKQAKTTEKFIEDARKVHGDKFDYSKVDYFSKRHKVLIGCREHGFFLQRPGLHLQGHGCSKCAYEEKSIKMRLNTDEWIRRAKEVHGDRYDYSQVSYVEDKIKVLIGCKKHGYFLQNPSNHLNGTGCPRCQHSKGENNIRKYLLEKNISFEEQKKFSDCRDKICLSFDFYLPDYNLLIEYQGIQHYESKEVFGGDTRLEDQIYKDNIKRYWCSNPDNPNLLEIPYYEDSISMIEKALFSEN